MGNFAAIYNCGPIPCWFTFSKFLCVLSTDFQLFPMDEFSSRYVSFDHCVVGCIPSLMGFPSPILHFCNSLKMPIFNLIFDVFYTTARRIKVRRNFGHKIQSIQQLSRRYIWYRTRVFWWCRPRFCKTARNHHLIKRRLEPLISRDTPTEK